MSSQARKNAVFAILISTLYSSALLTSTGVLMQNFLSGVGFGADGDSIVRRTAHSQS